MSDKTFLEQYILNENDPKATQKRPLGREEYKKALEARSKAKAEATRKMLLQAERQLAEQAEQELEEKIKKRVPKILKKLELAMGPFKFPKGSGEKLIATLMRSGKSDIEETKALLKAAEKPMSRRGMSVQDRFAAKTDKGPRTKLQKVKDLLDPRGAKSPLQTSLGRGSFKKPAKVYRTVAQKTVGSVWKWLWGSISSLWKAGKLKAVDAFKDGLLKGIWRVLKGGTKVALGGTIIGGILIAVDVFFLAYDITRAINKIVTTSLRRANLERHPWLNGEVIYKGPLPEPNQIADLLTPDKNYLEEKGIPWLQEPGLMKMIHNYTLSKEKFEEFYQDQRKLFYQDQRKLIDAEKRRTLELERIKNKKDKAKEIENEFISAMAADGVEVFGDEVRPGENYRDPIKGTAGSDRTDPRAKTLKTLKYRPKAGGTYNPRPSKPAIGIGDTVDFQENKEKNELLKIINEEIDKILG